MEESEIAVLKENLNTIAYHLSVLKSSYASLRALTDQALIIDNNVYMNSELNGILTNADSIIEEIYNVVIPTLDRNTK